MFYASGASNNRSNLESVTQVPTTARWLKAMFIQSLPNVLIYNQLCGNWTSDPWFLNSKSKSYVLSKLGPQYKTYIALSQSDCCIVVMFTSYYCSFLANPINYAKQQSLYKLVVHLFQWLNIDTDVTEGAPCGHYMTHRAGRWPSYFRLINHVIST